MNKRKISAKHFIKDFQDNSDDSHESNNDACDNSSKKTFDMDNLILNESKSNILEYDELTEILNNCSSCQLSDALKGISGSYGVIKGLKPVNNKKTYGKVFTAKTNPDDWGTSILAIDQAEKGDFLLIDSIGDLIAIWGELASKYAENNGIVGVGIYGASRDIDALINIDFPVFSLNTTPNAGTPKGEGKLNINLNLDDLIVKPGDFIFGDESGVVVIPKELFSEVIYQTNQIKINEMKIIEELTKGNSLSDIVF